MDPNTNLNEFFDAAKTAIAEANRLSGQVSELRKERDEVERNVNELKKKQADQIAAATRKRRAEIDKTYDGEIEKYNSQLKKAQARREKAKNQGIKERIEDETAELRADIKAIQARTKADFKANHVPGYCDSRFFQALYFPDGFGDILIILITFAIAFFVIPFGIYKLFFDGSTAALIIIYILDVIIFGGIYIGISRSTVMVYTDILRQAKLNQKAIEIDQQKIKAITRKIQNDENESYYDLAKYDDDIAHTKQELADITMKKNDAINTFENVTKNIIADEIISTTKPMIDDVEKRLAEVTARCNEADAAKKMKAAEIANNYEPYLGREFLSVVKIDKLREIINHGTATNISEAIEEYNRQYDI